MFSLFSVNDLNLSIKLNFKIHLEIIFSHLLYSLPSSFSPSQVRSNWFSPHAWRRICGSASVRFIISEEKIKEANSFWDWCSRLSQSSWFVFRRRSGLLKCASSALHCKTNSLCNAFWTFQTNKLTCDSFYSNLSPIFIIKPQCTWQCVTTTPVSSHETQTMNLCTENYFRHNTLPFLTITQRNSAKGSRLFLEWTQLLSACVHETDVKKSLNLNKQQWLTGSLE